MPRELLRLATAGSVDDGKSTLIGRLLLDTHSLLADHLEDVSRNGSGPDLAAITDGLRAEREQGITIDVAYRFFATQKRSFILADTPGHERYTRNMFTGTSTAELAILLIDARAGVIRQTRRHALITTLLGIRHLVVCINKMDLVEFSAERFAAVSEEVAELADRTGAPDVRIIPMSALDGDNVVSRSDRTPYYDGPSLLEYLETVDVQADRDLDRLRLPVQWVGRPHEGNERILTGRLEAGTLRAGDTVTVLPAGTTTTITSVDALDPAVEAAVPPMSVAVTLADRLDVGRGDMLVSGAAPPTAARDLECTVCWMGEEPLRVGARYALKHTTRTVRATVQAMLERTDPETLAVDAEPSSLVLNDIGRIALRTSAVIFAEPYAAGRMTGAFILIDEHTNDTVGAGVVLAARPVETPDRPRRDITWHRSGLERRERWSAIGQRGGTVLLTGLSGSGKSTIACELERTLVRAGRPAYLLDGDNIRHGLSADLGFSDPDRAEHVRRVGQVARLFADAGTVAVVSLIAPRAADRDDMRRAHAEAGLPFVEVFIDTPISECERRDPKGLYARARAGAIADFTGVSAPYEPPVEPDVRVETVTTDLSAAVGTILAALEVAARAERQAAR